MKPRGIVTVNFSISSPNITLRESRFKEKISLGKEVFMNGFEVNCFKSGSERVSLGLLSLPQGSWKLSKSP